MRLRVAAAFVAVAAALGAATVITGVFGSGDDGRPASDPRAAGLPRPSADSAKATLGYLRAEGAPLIEMHAAAREIPSTVDAPRCRSLVRGLNRSAPSNRVVALTAKVRDEPLRAALSDERANLGATLTGCLRGGAFASANARRAAGLVQARLDQLRAAG